MTVTALRASSGRASHHELYQAAVALFTRSETGNLDQFQYSLPDYPGDTVDGARLWSGFLERSPAYRLPLEEIELIRMAVSMLSRFGGQIYDFIDLGPGSVRAFRSKTLPQIDGLRPARYRPIDSCERFLADIETEMHDRRPTIEVLPARQDFLRQAVTPAHAPSWLFWGGGGFANIGTSAPGEFPTAGLQARLGMLKDILPAGGTCMLSLDSCRDAQRLAAAYDHPWYARLNLNVLHRIIRDCPAIVLDPYAWQYRPVWSPGNFALEHHLVSTRPQDILLGDHGIHVKAGESFIVDHSFKFPVGLVSEVAEMVGWRKSATLGRDGHTQLLMLSA